jgi:GH24 family phage-related lysozyme (muramidase)
VYGGGKVLPGLVMRREAEITLLVVRSTTNESA